MAICISIGAAIFIPAYAQVPSAPGEGTAESIQPIIAPVITSEGFVQVNRPVLFDASDSSLLPEPAPNPLYLWSFSDTALERSGKEVVRSFERTGKYTATLTIAQGRVKTSVSREIFVYDRQIVMITDKGEDAVLTAVQAQAAEEGVRMEVVVIPQGETEFLSEESLVSVLANNAETIDAADAFLFLTDSQLGLRGFTRYWRTVQDEEKAQAYRKKFYAVMTDGNMDVMAGITQQTFGIVRPPYILLTRREALNPIVGADSFSEIVPALEQRVIEHRTVDERSERPGVFLLSKLISRFVAQGVPSNVIYLLLAFPFIVFIIAFAREALGFSAFGIYTPAMVATAFLILGIEFGLMVFLIVVLVGWGVRWLVDRVELLFIPRTGLVLSTLALSFLIGIGALLYFQSPATIALAIFPMLVMSTVTEKFMAAFAEEGLSHALWGVVRTVVVVVAAYYAVTWTQFANFITSTPEYVFVPLIALFILGKFTGLRLSEYFRFKTLFGEGAEEE